MSDIRYDPVFNVWVAIARNRFERPMEFTQLESIQPQLVCPFCLGNEEETPEELAVYYSDDASQDANEDTPNWTVRVIPNKFPTFSDYQPTDKRDKKNANLASPYQTSHLSGQQEVIVCSPRHVTSISELTDDETLMTFRAIQDRVRLMQASSGIEHAMLFFNCRASAGASLSHIHAQLIGSPLVSDPLQRRIERFQHHQQEHGISLIEACAKWESQQRIRMIYQSDHFYVFCPYAGRTPFQVWMVPKHSQQDFSNCPVEMRDELARSCRWLVTRIEGLIDHPGYNLLLHQAPFGQAEQDHWFFEICPRLTRQAGFEWGTDIWVNPVSPETSARRLKLK